MIKKLESFLFFIFILSIPIQLGKHFWPSFAFVSGIRIDYLSPTLYVSDCSIVLLFLVSWLLHRHIPQLSKINTLIFGGLLIDMLLPFVFGSYSLALFYGIVKAVEFVFVGWFISQRFQEYKKYFLWANGISIVWVSTLAVLEFVLQHSVGGLFYFVGERTYSASTLGAATFSWNGIQILRPYATFPHPNVLAFFLLSSLLYLLFNLYYLQRKREWILAVFAVFFGSIVLFLTFSRILLIAYCISLLIFVYTRSIDRRWKSYFFGIVLSLFVIILSFSARFTYQSLLRDFSFRQSLIPLTVSIIEKSPVWGVGLNNFYGYEIVYQKVITPTFLQPVHNVYLLMAAEIGIVGLLLVCMFLYRTIRHVTARLKRKEDVSFFFPTLLIFVTILCAGLFDHYFITLQQGQLITAVVLGIAWSCLTA